MKTIIEKINLGFNLNENESRELLDNIIHGKLNESRVAAILALLSSRPLQLQELTGIAGTMMENCLTVKLDKKAIDVCGTGGDGKNTFNISTLSAFVLAAAGIPVAKHGNFASTSIAGSSDILKYFGYEFPANSDAINKQLNEYNVSFIHAPFFHPALKNVSKIRKELGIRTFFNMIGPLVNPADIYAKYVGVFNLETARLYHYYLNKVNIKYNIIYSYDGYDELSLTSDAKLYSDVHERTICPEELNLQYIHPHEILSGATIQESAEIFVSVLQNKSTYAQQSVVLANAALAYCCYDSASSYDHAFATCKEAVVSGKAYSLFKNLINQ